MPKLEVIKKAVQKRHGGFETATDAQIMTLWNALGAETQKNYLRKDDPNAVGDGPKSKK